jgi:hypothetical protein
MRRAGAVTVEGTPRPVGIEKRFVFRPRSIDVYYRVSNLGSLDLAARFGVEMNVSLAARSPECGRLFLLDEDRKREIDTGATEIEGVQGLLVRDVRNEVSVTLSSVRAFRCWSLPVETTIGDEYGQGRGAEMRQGRGAEMRQGLAVRPEFQSHCLVPLWELHLAPGEAWENHMSVGFEKTQST